MKKEVMENEEGAMEGEGNEEEEESEEGDRILA